MRIRDFSLLILSVASLALAGCSGGPPTAPAATATSIAGNASVLSPAAPTTSPTQAARNAGGPGSTNAKSCDVPYGDAPAQVSSLTSGGGAGALGYIANLFNDCIDVGGQTLDWTDRDKEVRHACLFVPPNASKATPLPLVVFLQGSLFPAPPQLILNNWIPLTKNENLSGDPNRPGFILLLPIGRNTHHYYPYPDNYALGFDNWYRNLDRSSPNLNLDVAAIDAFIKQVEGLDIVDTNRVYMTGWSNGAAMAELYALNTPSIAAAAVYSAPDPFKDVQDPCYQKPFATTMTPIMDIHNACDIVGTCQTSTAFHQELGQLYPKISQDVVILDSNKNQVQSCNAACAYQTPEGDPVGTVNHLLWPQKWNNAMFTWLRDHPLDSKPLNH